MIKVLIALFILVAGAAQAQVKHIVLDVNVLVQQIPKRNFESFKQKQQMFTVDKQYFYAHLKAKEFLNYLLRRPDMIVHLVSRTSVSKMSNLVNQIENGMVIKVTDGLGKIVQIEKALDLRLFSSDLNNVIFISHDKSQVVQQDRALELGPAYYKYESFEESETAKAKEKVAIHQYFPPSEIDWKRDTYKLLLVANLIKHKKLPVMNPNYDLETAVKFGSGLLEASKEMEWITNPGSSNITGCQGFDYVNEVPFTMDSLEKCLEKISHYRAWMDPSKKDCGYFTKDLTFIEQAPDSDCSQKAVLKNPKKDKLQLVDLFDGAEKLTIEELFKKLDITSHSYRDAILDDKIDYMDTAIPAACRDAIRAVYEAGGDFSLDYIKQRTVGYNQLKIMAGFRDRTFYHWSKYDSIKTVVRNNAVVDIFGHLRNRQMKYWWLYHFYVAKDRYSSSSYGNILVKVNMREDVRIYSEFIEGDPHVNRTKILSLIRTKYPSTSSCFGRQYYENLDLYFLAVEDSGAEMIQYYNNYGEYSPAENDYKFFQVLNPSAVETLELGN